IRFDVSEPDAAARSTFDDMATLAISEDGATVCLARANAGERVYVRHLSEPSSTRLDFVGSENSHSPAFSPDGRWIALVKKLSLIKIPADGGQPIELLKVPGLIKGCCWTPRGIVLSSDVNTGLSIIGADGGSPTTLTTPDAARGEIAHRWPDALP